MRMFILRFVDSFFGTHMVADELQREIEARIDGFRQQVLKLTKGKCPHCGTQLKDEPACWWFKCPFCFGLIKYDDEYVLKHDIERLKNGED